MSFLDKLRQAWQSQRCATPAMNPEQLLKGVRLQRRVIFWVDIFAISVCLCVGALTFWHVFRDIQQEWPWLIYSASTAWVVGCILFNRWRRRRYAAHYDESVLAHVEWSIKDIEHWMRLERNQLWWYELPIALGCMIPPLITFAMEYSKSPLFSSLFTLLITEGVFAAIFYLIHRALKYGERIAIEKRRQELRALRTLRESLLNPEESHV
jgi:phosphoglycerol transferase MdoB-like AlkP superfamily enzyme